MNLPLVIGVGAGVFFLAKKLGAVPSSAPPEADVKATLSGPDGTLPDKDGAALSAFPAVGKGGPAKGTVQTATKAATIGVNAKPGKKLPSSGNKPVGKSSLTQTMTTKKPTCRDATCSEMQSQVRTATQTLAPNLVF